MGELGERLDLKYDSEMWLPPGIFEYYSSMYAYRLCRCHSMTSPVLVGRWISRMFYWLRRMVWKFQLLATTLKQSDKWLLSYQMSENATSLSSIWWADEEYTKLVRPQTCDAHVSLQNAVGRGSRCHDGRRHDQKYVSSCLKTWKLPPTKATRVLRNASKK